MNIFSLILDPFDTCQIHHGANPFPMRLPARTAKFPGPAMFAAPSSSSSSARSTPERPNFSAVAAAAAVRTKLERGNAADIAAVAALLDTPSAPARSTSSAAPRTSRYIRKLVASAEERKLEHQIALDRRLAKDAPSDEERFVTAAYQKSLAGEPSSPHFPRARRPRTGRRTKAQSEGFDKDLRSESPAEAPPKRQRRSRFADAASKDSPGLAPVRTKPLPAVSLRGARRNDAASIAAYRARYLARERKRCSIASAAQT